MSNNEENETSVEIISASAIGEITKSEIQSQVDVAHKYPRSIKKFLLNAKTMATMTKEISESCIYALPRGRDPITGPSVRLAEIAASTYGNLQIGARVADSSGPTEVVSQGMAWDMENNVRISIETRRSILNKFGQRYSADMVAVTGNAGASIALRNAIFRIIPKCYIDEIYRTAVDTAVGDSKTFAATRTEWIARLNKTGISTDRILARFEKASVEDLTLEDIEKIIGLGNAIKNKDITLDEAFPAVKVAEPESAPAAEGHRMSLKNDKKSASKTAQAQLPIDDGSLPPNLEPTDGELGGRE
jgi:hypothetical protein